MTDTKSFSSLRQARDAIGFSREEVVRMVEPPISSKTLERWEKNPKQVPLWRLEQLAHLYRTSLNRLRKAA